MPVNVPVFAFERPMSPTIRVLVRASGVGGLTSGVWHVLTLMNLSLPSSLWVLLLIGMFCVWLAALIAAGPLNERIMRAPRKLWAILLECAPRWMRALVVTAWVYATINWVLATGSLGRINSRDEDFQRVASAVLVAFYATAAATLYSAGAGRHAARCPQGHLIRDKRQICPVCGTPPDI